MKTDLLVIRERFFLNYAGMAELADAPDLGSGVYDVQVQVLLSAFFIRLGSLMIQFPTAWGYFAKGLRQSLCTPWAFLEA